MSVDSESTAQETILKIIQTEQIKDSIDPLALVEDESNISQHEPVNVHKEFDPLKTRERKFTEKGKSYQKNIRDAKRKECYTKLKQRIEKIRSLIESVSTPDVLEGERDILDLEKEEFNEASRHYEEVLDSTVDKEEAYHWFDVRDREYTEFRMRLSHHLRAWEKNFHDSKSVRSIRSSRSSRSSKTQSRLIEAATKAAKLETQMQFLDREAEIRRLQLEKEIAMANAEKKAITKIIAQHSEQSKPKDVPNKEYYGLDDSLTKEVSKPAINHPPVKAEPFELDPNTAPFTPRTSFQPLDLPEEQVYKASEVEITGLKELLALQTKQAELSALIVDQQKMSSLPAQEPPVFTGNYFDYPSFVSAFDAIISSRVSSTKDKLYFLSKYTAGKAHDIVKNFLTLESDTAYDEARKLLTNRYGNPVRVAEAYKAKLRNWPQIKDGDSHGLQELADFLTRCENAMKSLRYMEELSSTKVLQKVSAKLPSYLGNKWCRYAREIQKKSDDIVSFHHLVDFVKDEADLATDPIFSPERLKKERLRATDGNRGKHKIQKETNANSFASCSERSPSTGRERRTKGRWYGCRSSSCSICEGNHGTDTCPQLKEKEVVDRLEVIKGKDLCFGCLQRGHRSKNCRVRLSCEECGKQHPTILHNPVTVSKGQSSRVQNVSQNYDSHQVTSKPESPTSTSPNANVCSSVDLVGSVTNSMIVPVIVHHKDNPQLEVKVYALLDDASDTTFIKTSVKEQLGVQGIKTSLILSTMLGREDISVFKVDGLIVERIDKKVSLELPRTYSRDQIPSRRNQIPRPEVAEMWPHLTKIKDKIMPYQEDLEIGLLIGCNCPKAIKPKEVILGKGEDPYALRTLLGWGIVGPVGSAKHQGRDEVECTTSMCNRILTREIGGQSHPQSKNISFILQPGTKERISPLAVKRMFEQDFSEVNANTQGLSSEDRKFLAIAEEGIRHLDNGHYELPLPLKHPTIKLPNNRELAARRLNQLKKRFLANDQYRRDYVAFMENIITSGYAERVVQNPRNDVPKTGLKQDLSFHLKPSIVWYIPHHGVYHPKKPTKIRVVFDCAAEYKGESLNKKLLQGPDLTNTLTGVLTRFRQEPIGFMCDIEAKFHQVKVAEEHRDMLRFLWWESGDISREPVEYRMTVHLFGATSSPGCANFALKRTAQDNEKEFGPTTAHILRRNFYVDDGLKSCSTVEEAKHSIKSVKEMCKRGGFNLHKFVSNKKEVIRSIPESDRAEGVKNIDLNLDKLPMERVLGVHWCIQSDAFCFRIVLQDRPCTRRGILSTVSSIFDPLGFIAPVILEGKSILQELCRNEVEWDDPIPEVVKARWEKWRSELHLLEQFSVPRCIKPEDFGCVVKGELHHFCDASNKGYGQCSYLRLENEFNKIHCSFVNGKSRVTPLRPMTTPRLELQAAVTSVRVSQQLHLELDLKDVEEVFWCDSKVVLGYIANESRRFHVYVANRVQFIQEATSISQWRHVDTELNPADDASRGLSVSAFLRSRWTLGPEFLWKSKDQWPSDAQRTDQSICELSQHDPEVKRVTVLATAVWKSESIEDRLTRFSDWHCAKKAIGLILLYLKRLKNLANNQKQEDPSVKVEVEDIKAAESVIIKSVQGTHFQKELESIKSVSSIHSPEVNRELMKQKKACTKSSVFQKLDPFIDSQGVLRAGGRLRRSSLSYGVRFPIILPRSSHVTSLIIRYYHEKVKHQGRGITLNELRANGYWIIGGVSAVGSYIGSCVICRKLRAAVQEQKMADLPQDRLEPAAPFTYCAVDYFGPWMVKEGRKEIKRYGVLFTCLTSRAVHLETSSTLETDSFVNALRRFICRRGPVRQLRCDQGTNFVGAKRELKEAISELNDDHIRAELLRENCDWVKFKMNVPAASHMGGIWERQIRSVRNILTALLQNNGLQLDDESLRTLMCEAEAIVNSRPLSIDNLSDPDALSPLTPNHLLTMKSKVVLSPPGNFQSADKYCRKRWRRVQHLANEFWARWRKEFLLSLQQRQKWTRPRRDLCVDDVVLIKDENLPRNRWQLARVATTNQSADGRVRTVKLALASQIDNRGRRLGDVKYLERPVQRLVLLMSRSEPESK